MVNDENSEVLRQKAAITWSSSKESAEMHIPTQSLAWQIRKIMQQTRTSVQLLVRINFAFVKIYGFLQIAIFWTFLFLQRFFFTLYFLNPGGKAWRESVKKRKMLKQRLFKKKKLSYKVDPL